MLDEQTIYSIVEKAKKYDELVILSRTKEVSCSFCGKSQSVVSAIVVDDNANICNECVQTCVDILVDKDIKFTIPKLGEEKSE